MIAGVAVPYTMAAYHLSTAVSELPEYLHKNRNVSIVVRQGRNNNEHSDEIYNSDGTIKNGHIPNWRNLSPAERELVKQERKEKGKSRDENMDSNSKSDANRIKQLTASNKKMERRIKALKRSNKKGGEDNDNGDTDTDMDAGDQFGGKASKRKKNEAWMIGSNTTIVRLFTILSNNLLFNYIFHTFNKYCVAHTRHSHICQITSSHRRTAATSTKVSHKTATIYACAS